MGDGASMVILLNEIDSFINTLSMASVSREAREHAIKHCRNHIKYKTMHLDYVRRASIHIDYVNLPSKGPDSLHSSIPGRLCVTPTALIVSRSCDNKLKSPAWLLHDIGRLFGHAIKRIRFRIRDYDQNTFAHWTRQQHAET